ncbi:MAG: hypothetical protein ACREDU_00150, partial [Methylocella sp.]
MNLRTENRDLGAVAGGEGSIRLGLLGPFFLSLADGREVAVTTKKNRAMLAILALSPGGQSARERLCGLLWG